MQLALRPRLLDLWSYGPGQLGAMVCEEADDGSGDLELEQYQAKDSDGDAYTATRGAWTSPTCGASSDWPATPS